LQRHLPGEQPEERLAVVGENGRAARRSERRDQLPALATGLPSVSGRNEKSVSWLFRKKPPTARPEPNNDSTEVVIDTTSPSASTTTK
jgi:hypothetical protein